ncbi:alpha/beta fold hydrolase [Arthrobacter sp. I2-34]|uniref:Alpha/beta fold hydrolase n=1 Tax=Arthrobacter hankyongi TaxID=2904801 RepID=A0ABS9L2Q3_9MICC|nr:alpha/beta hydrolase [Arthrobacter hankyongi]MCG2620885.1 alpha/beta fold hydrolase [Arthrobacter hankyongi]
MVQTVQSADGTTIAYEQDGSGPPLILVGGALSARQGAAALVPLLAGDFTVISYDRRGRGDSTDTPPYAVEREIEDLRALAGAAGGPVQLYGHSSGAILCLEAVAAGLPVDKVAVYEPPYFTHRVKDEPWQVFLNEIQALADAGHWSQAVEAFIRHTGAHFDEGIKQSPWWPAAVALAPTLPYDLTLTADAVVPEERFGSIAVPVLALYGSTSPDWAAAAAAAVASSVKDGHQGIVPGQGHGADPKVLAPFLIGFFRD